MEIANFIQIADAAGQPAAFLSPQADGVKDCYPDFRLNGESTFTFKLPANSEKIAELTPECQIWAGGRVYSMLKDEAADVERDQQGKLWAVFMAKECWSDLQYQYPEPYITNDPNIPEPMELETIIVSGGSDLSGGLYEVGSAGHALYAVLDGSDWSVGIVDVPGTHDLQTEKTNRLELVKAIQEKWGGYLVWDSENKTVGLRDAATWQNYTGFQVRYAKNLKHITRTQNNRIITKLYPFGHDGLLDIAAVNGGVKYITNYSFSSRELVGVYHNQDIYDQQELLDKATAELAILCRPRFQYSVKIADLRTLPEYSHEDFTVGDMADVIDPYVAADSPRVRILRHKYNLFQPWECEIELGDPLERFVEQLKASFDTSGLIDGKFNGSGRFSGYSLEDLTVEDAKIKNLSAEKVFGNLVESNTAVTHVLYAQEGKIARLTVDHLLTGDFLAGTEKIYFIDAQKQYMKFIEGTRNDSLPQVQYADEDEAPLYWNSEAHEYMTPTATEWPVMVYQYDYLTKLELNFETDAETGTMVPKIIYGAGAGVVGHPKYGKGYDYKGLTEFLRRYYSSTGKEKAVNLTDTGLEIINTTSGDVEQKIIFSDDGIIQTGNTGTQGLRNIHVSDTEPTNPQENDLWIDTDIDFVDLTMRRIDTVNINKSLNEVTVLMEGETVPETITYTEDATSMTFEWPDGHTATVSIS